ncbi:MAG: DUF899 family protein [Sneathiella sp.]
MKPVSVVTKEEWIAASRAQLAREKAFTREKDKLTEQRKQLPWLKIEKDYVFEAEAGEVSLEALFGNKSQLIVYHFMFGPDWEEGCVSCSYWADNFNGLQAHLAARDIAFVAISRAPVDRIMSFKKRMGWDFNWVSSHGNSFNEDFDVYFGPDHTGAEPVFYNFTDNTVYPATEAHGTSVLAKGEDGSLYRTYSTFFRGLDITNAAYSYMDMTPKGRNEQPEGNPMSWLRHHDKY